MEKDGSCSEKSLWPVSLEDTRSKLSLGKSASQESGNENRILQTFSWHAFQGLLNLMTETVIQKGRPFASHEAVMVVFKVVMFLVESFHV